MELKLKIFQAMQKINEIKFYIITVYNMINCVRSFKKYDVTRLRAQLHLRPRQCQGGGSASGL